MPIPAAKRQRLLEVSPLSQGFDHLLVLQSLVHEPMLKVDSARVRAGKITDQLLERRWILKRISQDDGQQELSFLFESG